MEFEVQFYETLAGRKPAEEFLNELYDTQPKLAKHTLANLKKIKNRERHGPPLTQHLGDNLFEMRTGASNISRIFFAFGRGRTIWLLSGFVKKAQATPQNELDNAYTLRDELEERRL